MKKLLIALGALIVVVIAAAIIVPFFIPVETYKQEVSRQVENATGRTLAIKGDVGFSVLPTLGLEAKDVAFSNAPGGRAENMATLSELVVELKLFPLFRGEAQVDSFVLVDPVIHLEVDKNGRPNWQFDGKAAPAKETAPAAPDKAPGGGPALADVSLGDVRLVNGTVTYFDAAKDQSLELTEINMTVSLPSLDEPLESEGSLVWNGEKVEVEFEAEKPRALMSGGTTALALEVDSEPVELDYEGSATMGDPLKAAGEVALDVPSVRELAAWAGKPIQMQGEGLEALSVAGTVGVEGQTYSFTEAKVSLDGMNAEGEVSADLSGQRPRVEARLDVDKIDLNTYLPPEPAAAAGGKKAAEAPEAKPAGPGEWSDEPIDVSGLRAADADLAFSAGAIYVRKIEVGRSALSVTLEDGRLTADLTELALYDGSAKGSLAVDGSGQVPGVKASFDLQELEAEPFLIDAADFDRLTGTGSGDISVSTKGRSQRQMVQALNGNGALKFTDGAIKGINLAAMVRNVKSAFLDKGEREEQKTDFAELSGTFTITNGILKNDDLKLLNPLLRLNGAGTSDIPKRTVNYRLEPKLVATTKGQGGKEEAKGIAVPVIIEGPWHDLTYRPDLSGAIKDMAKDPAGALKGAEETLEGVKEGATGGIEGMIPGAAETAPAEETAPSAPGEEEGGLVPDPEKAIEGLFGD